MMNIGMTDRLAVSVGQKFFVDRDEGAQERERERRRGEREEQEDKGARRGLFVRTEYTVADFSYNAI